MNRESRSGWAWSRPTTLLAVAAMVLCGAGVNVVTATPAAAAVVPHCRAESPTAADTALAQQLRPSLTADMRTILGGGNIACARVIANVVRSRNLPERATQIAIITAIVESRILNLDHGDRDSLGLFQQRPSQGWGTEAQILDPVYATNAFLNAMLRKFPNGSWQTTPIGEVCQQVQVSAFPERYQPQAADALIIARAVAGGADSFGYYNARTGGVHLRNALNSGSSDYSWDTNLETEPTAIALSGDWDGDGRGSFGYYNARTGGVHLRNALDSGSSDYAWDTNLETEPNAQPLTGDWDGR